MTSPIVPIILSGGSGSRLWPLSRSQRPKQFLNLTSDLSLFQQTLDRLQGLSDNLSPIVVANTDHRFLVGEQCRSVGVTPLAILLEPFAKNTAPAICAAAEAAINLSDGVDPVLLVLPSDHLFSDVNTLHSAIRLGQKAADSGSIVTFGIKPSYPETGYGYIKAKSKLVADQVADIDAFVEKPDMQTAHEYIANGCYSWNSGMFMFKASTFLAEFAKFNPSTAASSKTAWEHSQKDLEFIRLQPEAFGQCLSESIDYALMEKTDKAVVIPLDAGWNDVGAWSAVWQELPQDSQGNASRGDVLLEDTSSSYVQADNRLVALLGVDNLVVVETADAVLVAHKSKAQDVKKIVNQLKIQNRPEIDLHRKVLRPWGSYESMDNGNRFQVKRIEVDVGAKLSLQLHYHRAEHWVVVSGTALVLVGDTPKIVAENESVYIPIGVKHCLENLGKVPLHLIEVQVGSYLGEDDIVRFEDLYGRV